MNASTTIPATVEITRGRLLSLVVGVAAAAAAITWAVSAYAVESGGGTVQANVPANAVVTSLPIPPTGYLDAVSSRVTSLPIPPNGYLDAVKHQSKWVQAITSMTPVQLIEAFGTDVRTAVALAGLTPKERQYVESIITSTPAQLRAAFGTSTRTALALAGLTPKERQYVESIITSTPAQLRAAFGTSGR